MATREMAGAPTLWTVTPSVAESCATVLLAKVLAAASDAAMSAMRILAETSKLLDCS